MRYIIMSTFKAEGNHLLPRNTHEKRLYFALEDITRWKMTQTFFLFFFFMKMILFFWMIRIVLGIAYFHDKRKGRVSVKLPI